MTNYTDYNKLSKIGDEGEQRFIKFLQIRNFTNITHIDDVYEEEGLSRSDWDVRATKPTGETITYEVKTQDDCHTFGAVNIEQVQSGKPSGIAISTADIWVFVNKTKGFGCVHGERLKKIHHTILKDPSVGKKAYLCKVKKGDIQLWMTGYKNMACGFRMSLDRLKWFNQETYEKI